MEIVDTAKLAIGVIFFVFGAGLLVYSRKTRGFGQHRQVGLLMLLGGALVAAVALGLVERPW